MDQPAISFTHRAVDHPEDRSIKLWVQERYDGGMVITCDQASFERMIPERKRNLWSPRYSKGFDDWAQTGWQIGPEHVRNANELADWLVGRFRR